MLRVHAGGSGCGPSWVVNRFVCEEIPWGCNHGWVRTSVTATPQTKELLLFIYFLVWIRVLKQKKQKETWFTSTWPHLQRHPLQNKTEQRGVKKRKKELYRLFLDCLHPFSESLLYVLRILFKSKNQISKTPHFYCKVKLYIQNSQCNFYSKWYFAFRWKAQTIITYIYKKQLNCVCCDLSPFFMTNFYWSVLLCTTSSSYISVL